MLWALVSMRNHKQGALIHKKEVCEEMAVSHHGDEARIMVDHMERPEPSTSNFRFDYTM